MQTLASRHVLGGARHAANDLGSEEAQPSRPQSEVLEVKRPFALWICNAGITIAIIMIVAVIVANPHPT